MFYGWRVAAVAALSNLISTGLVLWTLGIFVYPLEREFGWTRAEISFATSVAFVVAGIAGPFVGRLNDWYGSRPLMLAGSAIMGLGIVSLAWLDSLWQLYLLRGLGSIMGVMGVFMTVALVAAPDLAGLAYDLSRSYTGAFIVLAGLSLAAALAALLVRPAVQPPSEAP